MRYVVLLVELSISSFEILHFGQWPIGGAILKKSAIFSISETIHRIVFKLFLHQFRYIEKLQKFQNRCYRVIQIWENTFFWKFAIFKKWPHQLVFEKLKNHLTTNIYFHIWHIMPFVTLRSATVGSTVIQTLTKYYWLASQKIQDFHMMEGF